MYELSSWNHLSITAVDRNTVIVLVHPKDLGWSRFVQASQALLHQTRKTIS